MSTSPPVGELVASHPAPAPTRSPIKGTHVSLVPIDESHGSAVFQQTRNTPAVWAYMPVGPFDNEEAFTKHMKGLVSSSDPLFFTIMAEQPIGDVAAGSPLGYLSFMNIDLANRSIEIGNITFSPVLQRTTAATETLYLAMSYCLRDLGMRRLEWKCDSLNAKSRRAALRLGFVYEGLFRQHRIVKGRNRDTTWYSITDSEWASGLDKTFTTWLDGSNFENGKQIETLEQIRGRLVGKSA